MKGMINKIISNCRKAHLLGWLLLAIAGIFAGCSTEAKSVKTYEDPAPKREATAAPTPVERTSPDTYFEREFEGDSEYSTPKPAAKSTANINRATFEKIRIGMTLAEVEKLTGEKGMLVSTMDVNGRKTRIYKWSNDNFTSSIDVTIENEKVVEKADKNLK